MELRTLEHHEHLGKLLGKFCKELKKHAVFHRKKRCAFLFRSIYIQLRYNIYLGFHFLCILDYFTFQSVIFANLTFLNILFSVF